jgi:hypothetical protein
MTTVLVEDLDAGSKDAGVAAHYGDPMAEQRLLETMVGLVDRSNRDVIAVPGEERAGWLHTLTTQHLSALGPNQGSELLVLSPHGHVEQHAYVTEDGTTAWLDTEPGAGEGLLKYLEAMRFFTRVEPRDATREMAVLSLVGPDASAVVGDLAEPRVGAVPGPKFAAGSVPPGATSRYDVRPFMGGLARRVPLGIDLLVPRESVPEVRQALAVPSAGLLAYEAIRVAHRIPRLGGRPTTAPSRPRPASWPRRSTWTRAATAGRRPSPGCTTSAGPRVVWCCCISTESPRTIPLRMEHLSSWTDVRSASSAPPSGTTNSA